MHLLYSRPKAGRIPSFQLRNHRITEQLGLEGTLKSIHFQPPAVYRAACSPVHLIWFDLIWIWLQMFPSGSTFSTHQVRFNPFQHFTILIANGSHLPTAPSTEECCFQDSNINFSFLQAEIFFCLITELYFFISALLSEYKQDGKYHKLWWYFLMTHGLLLK